MYRRRSPSTEFWAALVPAAITLAVLYLAVVPATRPITDPDIFFHLSIGDWILDHRELPTTDPFSQLGADQSKTWVAYSWLFEIAMSGLYRVAGWTGVMLYAVITAALIAATLLGLLLRYEPRRAVAALWTALALLTLWPLFSVRPWLLTVLFFILELGILLRVRETGNWKKYLWLVPLFVLWANIHIQFVYGLLLIGVFGLEPLVGPLLKRLGSGKSSADLNRDREAPVLFGLDPRKTPKLWWYAAVGVGCAAACLVNPFGWRLGVVIVEYATQSVPLRGVMELTPPDFRSVPEVLALILLLVALLAWGFRSVRSPLPIMLLVFGALFFLKMRRDIWFLAISASLMLAMARLGLSQAALLVGEGSRQPAAGVVTLERWGWKYRAGLVLGVVLMLGVGEQWPHFKGSWHEEHMARRYPVAAAEYVRANIGGQFLLRGQNHAPIRGPLFNSFDWGGYLIWALPELPVAIDGRTNLYGSEYIQRTWDTWDGKPGWNADPVLAHANLVIAEDDSPLAGHLFTSRDFERVYRDATEPRIASVFARVDTNLVTAPNDSL